jgi:hypothetical protein
MLPTHATVSLGELPGSQWTRHYKINESGNGKAILAVHAHHGLVLKRDLVQ